MVKRCAVCNGAVCSGGVGQCAPPPHLTLAEALDGPGEGVLHVLANLSPGGSK
jgi:hypothetical protein